MIVENVKKKKQRKSCPIKGIPQITSKVATIFFIIFSFTFFPTNIFEIMDKKVFQAQFFSMYVRSIVTVRIICTSEYY